MNTYFQYARFGIFWASVMFLVSQTACGDCGAYLEIRGQVVDAQLGNPIEGATIGSRIFTEGVETNLEPYPRRSDTDGSFTVSYSTFGGCPPPPIPTPDQLEIRIVRDGCSQTMTIEIDEATAQFIDQSGGEEIRIREPILVPACEDSP